MSDSNITIAPDVSLEDAVKKGPFDVVILPGGESAADIMAHVYYLSHLLHTLLFILYKISNYRAKSAPCL